MELAGAWGPSGRRWRRRASGARLGPGGPVREGGEVGAGRVTWQRGVGRAAVQTRPAVSDVSGGGGERILGFGPEILEGAYIYRF